MEGKQWDLLVTADNVYYVKFLGSGSVWSRYLFLAKSKKEGPNPLGGACPGLREEIEMSKRFSF